MNSEVLIQQVASLLEVTPSALTLSTPLVKFDTWDSLAKISVLAAVHENYGITLEAEDLERIATLGELSELIQNTRTAGAT